MSFKDIERRLRKQELTTGVGMPDRIVEFHTMADPRVEGSVNRPEFRIRIPSNQRLPCSTEYISHTNEGGIS